MEKRYRNKIIIIIIIIMIIMMMMMMMMIIIIIIIMHKEDITEYMYRKLLFKAAVRHSPAKHLLLSYASEKLVVWARIRWKHFSCSDNESGQNNDFKCVLPGPVDYYRQSSTRIKLKGLQTM